MFSSLVIFNPLIDPLLMAGLAGLALVMVMAGFYKKQKGVILRALGFVVLLLTLANPQHRVETRETLPNVVFIGKDISASNMIADRKSITTQREQSVRAALETVPNLVVRDFTFGDTQANQTTVFEAWNKATENTPPHHIAGTILISDGNIHDGAQKSDVFDKAGPVHILLTGKKDEKDRRIVIKQAPTFGLVGKDVTLEMSIHDEGAPLGSIAAVTLSTPAVTLDNTTITPGETATFTLPIEHAGTNFFTIETPFIEGELTPLNNKTVIAVEGVRDRLKVLLVSGLPHNGERVWRNLLKSDPNIDLVHFTIMRSPDKQDLVPVNELALIPFPVKELFVDKINEFDLIIFDRFARFGLVPPAYINNIATFIENGGAFLDVSGPNETQMPFFTTQLDQLLPAPASPNTLEGAYTPMLSDNGNRHPITRPMRDQQDQWGEWFRQTGITANKGKTLMTGLNDEPLLVISDVGEGRIAQLLSDQIWLWARGYDQGGPHQEFLRRLSHWLMKEPDLQENRIEADVKGMQIALRVFSDDLSPQRLIITKPDGSQQMDEVTFDDNGQFSKDIIAEQFGVYRFQTEKADYSVSVGGLNQKEFEQLTATDAAHKIMASVTKGRAFFLNGTANSPTVRYISERTASAGGANWMGLIDRQVYKTLATKQSPLIPALWGLMLAAGLVVGAWVRESR